MNTLIDTPQIKQRNVTNPAPLPEGATGGFIKNKISPPKAAPYVPKPESSYGYDFMAGVEPTGKYTFRSAIDNRKNHGKHIAATTVGGFVGGAAITPAVISALALGVPKYITAGKDRNLGIIARSAVAPYKMLYQGIRGRAELGRIMSGKGNKTKYIEETLKGVSVGDLAEMADGLKGNIMGGGKLNVADMINKARSWGKAHKDIPKRILTGEVRDTLIQGLRENKDLANEVKSKLNLALITGGGSIALSGGLSALSAHSQYKSGLSAQEIMRQKEEEMNRKTASEIIDPEIINGRRINPKKIIDMPLNHTRQTPKVIRALNRYKGNLTGSLYAERNKNYQDAKTHADRVMKAYLGSPRYFQKRNEALGKVDTLKQVADIYKKDMTRSRLYTGAAMAAAAGLGVGAYTINKQKQKNKQPQKANIIQMPRPDQNIKAPVILKSAEAPEEIPIEGLERYINSFIPREERESRQAWLNKERDLYPELVNPDAHARKHALLGRLIGGAVGTGIGATIGYNKRGKLDKTAPFVAGTIGALLGTGAGDLGGRITSLISRTGKINRIYDRGAKEYLLDHPDKEHFYRQKQTQDREHDFQSGENMYNRMHQQSIMNSLQNTIRETRR